MTTGCTAMTTVMCSESQHTNVKYDNTSERLLLHFISLRTDRVIADLPDWLKPPSSALSS